MKYKLGSGIVTEPTDPLVCELVESKVTEDNVPVAIVSQIKLCGIIKASDIKHFHLSKS
jgi:hypothetical protein